MGPFRVYGALNIPADLNLQHHCSDYIQFRCVLVPGLREWRSYSRAKCQQLLNGRHGLAFQEVLAWVPGKDTFGCWLPNWCPLRPE